ncbi:MAG: OmpA family protein [Proteobacteria bacterium]|uniref:OmpA family protein n=1 Tax=Candidatus Avisuccinivibrio stercorigallinarum TaxID=2840704 RepID=A0A9D9GSX0_9GAMM|nr:OmpA family protein [Candidatus Avisuccinivibrio stercorigallinarum]
MKKPEEPHENLERWMVSYADFLTLMFAVFVVLYSFAMTKQSEAQSMVQGLVQSFNEMGMISSTPGVIALPGPLASSAAAQSSQAAASASERVSAPVQGGGGVMSFGMTSAQTSVMEIDSETDSGEDSITQRQPQTEGTTTEDSENVTADGGMTPGGQAEEIAEGGSVAAAQDDSGEAMTGEPFDAIERSISSTIEELGIDNAVVIEKDHRWLTINIGSALLFAQDSAAVLNSARPVIAQIAAALRDINNYIRVRGYTDNLFASDGVYKNNWELSSARAIAVLEELENFGIDPSRLAAEAYSQYAPFYSNSTAAGRAQNRRVVIAISRNAIDRPRLEVLPGNSENLVQTPQAVRAGSVQMNFSRGADGSLDLNFN